MQNSWCLVEHELYHAAQETDAFGDPKFSRSTGRPAFTIRGHELEEFVGVVRGYGADAAGVRGIVDAANRPPEIARAQIAHACGTRQLMLA
nr:putative metallopeptidase [Sinorhizobium meliloti]